MFTGFLSSLYPLSFSLFSPVLASLSHLLFKLLGGNSLCLFGPRCSNSTQHAIRLGGGCMSMQSFSPSGHSLTSISFSTCSHSLKLCSISVSFSSCFFLFTTIKLPFYSLLPLAFSHHCLVFVQFSYEVVCLQAMWDFFKTNSAYQLSHCLHSVIANTFVCTKTEK